MSDEIRLVIAIPTSGLVQAVFAYSLAGLVARLSQGIPTRPEATLLLSVDVQQSSVIHSNREQLVRRAIDNNNTHLMFLDDDMKFEPQVGEILLGRRLPVVGTNYAIKEFPLKFVAVAPDGRRIITKEASTGLQAIAYTGFGVSMFDLEVFKKTPQPWFQTEFVAESNCYTTEDNPCFRRIREAGFPCYLDHDASKLVTHMGPFAYHWSQWSPEKPKVKDADQ